MKILYADRSDRNYVRCVNDVVYDTSKDIPLHLQMLYPQVPSELAEIRAAERDGRHKRELSEAEEKRSARSMPCIVYVQGSAWGKQDIYGTLPMLVDIARMGFVVASVEYRPVTMEPFPGRQSSDPFSESKRGSLWHRSGPDRHMGLFLRRSYFIDGRFDGLDQGI